MKVYKQAWFWLLVGIVVFLINQLPFLTDMRPVMYDEAWYANTGYNFSQGDGFLNTVAGTRGNSNYLLPTLTGLMFWVFGYSLFTIRLTAVLCGVVTMIFLHLCMKELKSSVKAEIAVLAFFVSIALFNTIFRFGRPECASLMCMAGGIWFLLRYIQEKSWGNMMGLSVFTFLATIGHPYALLFFALTGTWLLFNTIQEKKWMNLTHLILLLLAAVAAIGSIAWVSYVFNGSGEDYVSTRFSISNIWVALPEYLKECFISKHSIYMIPLFAVAMVCCRSQNLRTKVLAYVALVYLTIFPFLFSTDLMMIGLGLDYVALISTILIAPCVDRIKDKEIVYRRLAYYTIVIYCLTNIGISYHYNYKVKYEKCNTVLHKELREIIPEDAVIFAPIRQYPLLLENKCYSDHYWKELPANYDYVVLNSQDKDVYENSIQIQKKLEKYELVYERGTKQYGVVQVFKSVSD